MMKAKETEDNVDHLRAQLSKVIPSAAMRTQNQKNKMDRLRGKLRPVLRNR